jgi:hypothetical protein
MVSEGILRVESRLPGRPKKHLSGNNGGLAKGEQKGKKPSNYQIILNQSAFEKIFHIYLNGNIKNFLTSRYTNKMIKESSFSTVYDIIKSHLERSEFRKNATTYLLNQPATIAEYKELGNFLKSGILKAYNYESDINSEIEKESIELSSVLSELGQQLSSTPIKPIEILSELDHLLAIRFYRKEPA